MVTLHLYCSDSEAAVKPDIWRSALLKFVYVKPASKVLALDAVMATQVPEGPILLSQAKAVIEELLEAIKSTEIIGDEEQYLVVAGKFNAVKKVGPNTRSVTTLLYTKHELLEILTLYLNPSSAVIEPLVLV